MTITKHLKSLFRPTINGFAMRHASASVTIAQTHGIQNSGAYKEIRARLTCCDTQPDLNQTPTRNPTRANPCIRAFRSPCAKSCAAAALQRNGAVK